MEEADRYEILAETGLLDDRTHVLKVGDTFGVFDRHGDVQPFRAARHGVFHDGTRFLSRLVIRIEEKRPILLGSFVRADNAALVVDLTNPDVVADERVVIARNTVHLRRRVSLRDAGCRVEVRLQSHGAEAAHFRLGLGFAADFIDIFELRGLDRPARGTLRAATGPARVRWRYEGLDGVSRISEIQLSPAPDVLTEERASYDVSLEPGKTLDVALELDCVLLSPSRARAPAGSAATPQTTVRHRSLFGCAVTTSSAGMDSWLQRSRADLEMMITDTPWGPYPYAGVPWFSTPFGRDGLVTALSTLWIEPRIARGVLRFLAAHQAREDAPEADAEPGKILHEMRGGEMAALGETPFRCYYGSVDVTPLFLVVADAYQRRTGDEGLIGELWPNLERAASWLVHSGDLDGDGFIEYRRRSEIGLTNHGWKDSRDSISHADGRLAEGPIALCEVQAYAYAAHRGFARLARRRDDVAHAREHDRAADVLAERFQRAFWRDDLGCYALALDGDKEPCLVRSSNAGQTLFTGIAEAKCASTIAQTLGAPDMFSGWGVRTLSQTAARFNPMSYHNGSVWPHDNALLALGLARYGHTEQALAIASALFEAAGHFADRLPELFCGFARVDGEGPTLYPVACAPQAWSAAAAFLLLQSALGLTIDATRHEVRFVRPTLPPFLAHLTIRDLRVADASLDLHVERAGDATGVVVLRRRGVASVIVES